jgi:hypothetical protein
MRTLAGLALLGAILATSAGCQQGRIPAHAIYVNYWIPRLPAGAVDRTANEVQNGTRAFTDPQLRTATVATLIMDTGATVNPVNGAKGGLCDVNSRSNLDSARLQAALTPGRNNSLLVSKIEITAGPGLRLGTEFTSAIVEIEGGGGNVWTSYGQYSRFTIRRFDRSVRPTRCIGEFECVLKKSGEDRLILLEGEFTLPKVDPMLPEYIP